MKKLIPLFSFFCVLWIFGFIAFYSYVIGIPGDSYTSVDAVVVFTGRKGRVIEGNRLVEQGLAKRLFISGLHKDVRLKDLPQQATVDGLGYKAGNTRQNAEELLGWYVRYKWNSIRLVTDAVHMPRSLWLTKQMCPHMAVIPHPLHSQTYFSLYVTEYHKWIYMFVKKILRNKI